jgi:diadenosine tetraphosphate (Ap4A) HIT family hydrolase
MKGEAVKGKYVHIADLGASTFYLRREQTYRGRCVLAYKDHVHDIVQLSAEDAAKFFEDVAHAARAIYKALSPDKINYAMYGDTLKHIHMHMVPKYKGGPDFGGTFQQKPSPEVRLTEEECAELADKIRKCL